jgi:hypothetical protein
VLAPAGGGTQTTWVQLAERDRAILDLERTWWQLHGSKEQAIRTELGISPSGYYRLLHTVVASPAAMIYDPLVVRRTLRAQAARRRARFEGKTVSSPPH